MSWNHKFVFLCGLHRSGTSPLFRILREHPEISGFRDTGVPEDEGQHLQTVFPAANRLGGPGGFGFASGAHLTEKSRLINNATRQTLRDEWSRHWDLDKPYLLEKSPPNLVRTRFLQEMFPDSYFIVLLRHPVAACLATSKWTGCSLESLFEHWLHCHALFEADRSFLKSVYVLRYEDLISDTNKEMERMYKFLDLKPYPASPMDPSGNDRYFQSWQKLSIDRGRRSEIDSIVRKHQEAIAEHGYSLTGLIPAS